MPVINTHNFGQFWSISSTITHRFGVTKRFQRLTIPGVRLRFRRQRSQFWPILTRFVDYYLPCWGPETISIVVEPQVALTCRSSTLTVLMIQARFLDFYSLFWGPELISMINKPQGAFTCRSSTLTILADSCLFRGLLHTVLGSRSDFHDLQTHGCVYVSVINSHNFGRFWSISNSITHCFGVPERFPRLTIPVVHLHVRHQHSEFWSILTQFLDYYSVLGSRSDFHD